MLKLKLRSYLARMSSFENQRIYQKKQLPVMKTTYFFVMLATFQNSTFGLFKKFFNPLSFIEQYSNIVEYSGGF